MLSLKLFLPLHYISVHFDIDLIRAKFPLSLIQRIVMNKGTIGRPLLTCGHQSAGVYFRRQHRTKHGRRTLPHARYVYLQPYHLPCFCFSWSSSTFSLFPSFSLPDTLCDPTDLIWRKGTIFEGMTGRTAPSSDSLLAEVFWGFSQL